LDTPKIVQTLEKNVLDNLNLDKTNTSSYDLGTSYNLNPTQQESTETKVERKRRMWREASKKSYYNNEKYRKNKNKRDAENYKTRYKKESSFRTKRLDYFLNRYRTESEFREKSLLRSKAWRDARKKENKN
jgi:hypothetical protein